jgi:hypothetical protein
LDRLVARLAANRECCGDPRHPSMNHEGLTAHTKNTKRKIVFAIFVDCREATFVV